MISWNTVALKLIVMFLVVCGGFVVFELTPFGKMGRAVGSNIEAARLSGVNITLIKFAPFIRSEGFNTPPFRAFLRY
jgi:ribose/xylose/arabinose/galactoside ABC-type transport system permease subunit